MESFTINTISEKTKNINVRHNCVIKICIIQLGHQNLHHSIGSSKYFNEITKTQRKSNTLPHLIIDRHRHFWWVFHGAYSARTKIRLYADTAVENLVWRAVAPPGAAGGTPLQGQVPASTRLLTTGAALHKNLPSRTN